MCMTGNQPRCKFGFLQHYDSEILMVQGYQSPVYNNCNGKEMHGWSLTAWLPLTVDDVHFKSVKSCNWDATYIKFGTSRKYMANCLHTIYFLRENNIAMKYANRVMHLTVIYGHRIQWHRINISKWGGGLPQVVRQTSPLSPPPPMPLE